MHSNDWSRALTERQREVLTFVVENKVYRNHDSRISEIATQMGIAPAAVAKHLLEIEKAGVLEVTVTPSPQGKRVYERLQLEPRPDRARTSEALDATKVAILRFIADHPEATASEVGEELGLSEYTALNGLRTLAGAALLAKHRGPTNGRGVPPYVYRVTPHGARVAARVSEEPTRQM